jgi:hypothetical protein
VILRPESQRAQPGKGVIAAWEAVAGAEKAQSASYQLIRQPDHARLSGKIVQHLVIAGAPDVDDDIVRGIGLHDEGWEDFDNGCEPLSSTPATYSAENFALNAEGKPLSFLDIKAGDFLRAWRASIDSAEAVAPIAALIVSGHFTRLGKFGISAGAYSDDDARSVHQFLTSEEKRQSDLLRLQSRSESQVQYWTDVLQFCDLLSLYLCCGSEESVEFPQRIGPADEPIRLRMQDGSCVLSPALFQKEVLVFVEAHPYPAAMGPKTIGWRLR